MPTASQYRPLDPNVATRQQFTDSLVNVPIPDNACEDWRDSATKLQSLLRKLADHEAMAPNLQQTFMTPANSRNKVYFMWDFVGRTLGYLYVLPVDVQYDDTTHPQLKDVWVDVIGRSKMAGGLIIDDKPGLLDSMLGGTTSSQATFSDEIIEEGRVLFHGQ